MENQPMQTTQTKIYVYTTNSARKKGVYKVGGTHLENATDRVEQQDGTSAFEPLELVWSSEYLNGVWDDSVRELLFRQGLVEQRTDKRREWVRKPNGAALLTDGEITNFIVKVVNTLENKGGLRVYRPTLTQVEATETFMRQFEEALQGNTEAVRGVLDLCARFGKTLWVLDLFAKLRERFGYSTLLLPAYWLSAHSSFEKEIEEFRNFNDFVFVDTSRPGWEDKLTVSQESGAPVVISLSLCGDASEQRLERFALIKNIPQDEVFLFCDEADVGAHTLRSAKVLNYVFPL
jgi:hypothetical protein